MMRKEENEQLTQVGPGTPMGDLMREYWIPACMSSELKSGAPPLRLLLLGEKLIGVRDKQGRAGILDHRCPHRCASLYFGRNEEGGLRCVYHGWKFDLDGTCLDQPNLRPEHQYKDKVRAKAYRTTERNGIVWTYMGPKAEPPPLPAIEPLLLPEDQVTVYLVQRECNWLQGLEGDIDTSHFAFLHGGKVNKEEVDPEAPSRFAYLDPTPDYHVKDTDWGTMYAAYRPGDPGHFYYRVAHFVFPFWTLIPDGTFSDYILGEGWVPMDDHHTMVWQVRWNVTQASARTLKNGKPIAGLAPNIQYLPQTGDWYGRWRHVANKSNDYMIDRLSQETETYSGVQGVGMQDQMVTESMGEIVDRSFENPGASDQMIVRTRRRMRQAMGDVQNGRPAPASFDIACQWNARSGDFMAPARLNWLEAYASQLKGAKNPANVERSFEMFIKK